MQRLVNQWTNVNGTVVRVYATDKPYAFTITKDDMPWNPAEMVDKATK